MRSLCFQWRTLVIVLKSKVNFSFLVTNNLRDAFIFVHPSSGWILPYSIIRPNVWQHSDENFLPLLNFKSQIWGAVLFPRQAGHFFQISSQPCTSFTPVTQDHCYCIYRCNTILDWQWVSPVIVLKYGNGKVGLCDGMETREDIYNWGFNWKSPLWKESG